MHRSRFLVPALAVAVALLLVADRGPSPVRPSRGGPYPSDWFGMQRAFPSPSIDQAKWRAAVEQARFDRAVNELTTSGGLVWTQAGPFNIGGRVTALAVAPGASTVYLGAANGGVFRSDNAGVNWTPVFDLGAPAFSIGALALEPGSAGVLYVGTGEANGSVDSYDGYGLYRTEDGGESWEHLGLAATARIARVAVDPSDPGRLYVAAMGTQFSTGPDRGLYRSLDRGQTWEQVLFVNDSTGVCDVVINPAHPETVFCATWERVRRPSYRRAYGPGCGIWRSVDFGATWTRLAGGLPAPSDAVGRIGLALAPSRPTTVYAQITAGLSGGYNGLGMYRTLDGGDSWVRRDAGGFTNSFGGFGWYFGDVAVDPADPEQVWIQGVTLKRSSDGGTSFVDMTGSSHVDFHGMWIDPTNTNRIYHGSDGGFYSSTNGGASWTKSVDLPITQFYAGSIDPSNPNRLLGGTQDNNSLQTSGSPNSWTVMLGGDGFQCLVDPTNPFVVFAEWQYCCDRTGLRRSTSSGNPGTFFAPSGFVGSDRYNWNTPIAMDPSDHNVLLVGSHRVYKSVNNGSSYSIVSGDLTTNPGAPLVYGTLSTLAISPVSGAVYYAGTDDGRVWRSLNAGGLWTEISAGLPVRYVTRVTPDPVAAGTVYVTLSGFGLDEHLAHVYRSTDYGDTWAPIAGNLPDVPANDVLADPADPNSLYLATDVGVYVTRDLGGTWYPLGIGMPLQAVFDLTLHAPSRTLVAATHGRSQWRLDLGQAPVAAGRAPAPARLSLTAPAPNPSRGEVRLTLQLPAAARVEVAVHDAAGRRVRTLASGALEAGRHALAWDGRNRAGRRAAAGVYFVRATSAAGSATRRVVLTD